MATQSVLVQAEVSAAPPYDSGRDQLVSRTLTAVGWRFASEGSRLGLQFITLVVLSRILPVEAFGLMTLCMIVVDFAARVSQMGMAQAVIQRESLLETHIRVAFWLSLISGLALATAIYAAAPLAAAAFREARVAPVLQILSLSFLFTSFGSTAGALLERKLDYRTLMKVELASYATGYVLVSIVLAQLGYGVWALAFGLVAYSAFRAVLLYAVMPHPLKPSLSITEARQLLNFGVGQTLGSVANYAALNGDFFVVGRWLGALALGLYSRAYQMISLPLYQVSSVISYVLFPVYSRMQNDSSRLGRAYLASLSFSSLVVMPLLAGIAIAAPEIMVGLFGPEWSGAITALQILCIGGVFHCTYSLGDALARAKGAVYAKFGCHSLYAVCVIAGSIVGSRWGITGVATSVVVALLIIYLLLARLSLRLVGLKWRDFFDSQIPGLSLALTVSVFALPTTLILRAAGVNRLLALTGAVAACLFGLVAGVVVISRLANQVDSFASLKRLSKSLLASNPRAYKLVEIVYENALFIHHALREGLWRLLARRHGVKGVQRTLTRETGLPDAGFPAQVVDWLRRQNINVREGAHTFYVPPQANIKQVLGDVSAGYPSGCGFKILKDFRAPVEARYLFKHRRTLPLLGKLIGTPKDQLLAANYLYAIGLGPRVWDLTCWHAGERDYTVFVLDHVEGRSPTTTECAAFRKELAGFCDTSQLRVLIPQWRENGDFQPPDCNGNLIYSSATGRTQYIDFQNFGLRNPSAWSGDILKRAKGAFHFGTSKRLRGGKYLYQSVPGICRVARRNTAKRWAVIRGALRDSGIDTNGRVVLDVGCNAGMMIHCALADGAAWAHGWDLPEVVGSTGELLLSLGATRFSLTGATLNTDYRIEDDLPEHLRDRLGEAVVFYLAVRKHLGLLESLSRIPWRALVYEGHQWEQSSEVPHFLSPLLTDGVEISAASSISDGDCGSRPLLVLKRRR